MAIKTTKGTASTFRELIEAITAFVTDTEIHGDDAWELMRDEPWPYGTIYKAKGREDGDRQYIGFLHSKYKVGETYDRWFMTEDNICSHFLWRNDIDANLTFWQNQAQTKNYPYARINTTTSSRRDPDSGLWLEPRSVTFPPLGAAYPMVFYFPTALDIFLNDAQALHLGVFKQYSDNPFADLGGAMDFKNLRLSPYYVHVNTRTTRTAFPYYLPPYPGCGYPALTLDYSGPMMGYMDYWLIKSASWLIVATNNGDVWEAAFAGQFEPYDAMKEYAFPSLVVGGTSGLREFFRKQYLPNSSSPTNVVGMRFDFRPHSWELSRSIPPFAAIPQDSVNTPSPVMAMLPDGVWQGFSNYVEGYTHNPQPPTETAFFIRPGEQDISDFFRNIHETKDSHILEPLELLQGQGDKKGLLGKIPQMFLPARPIQENGEIVAEDGKRYLALPNGWDGRSFTSMPTLIANLPTFYYGTPAERYLVFPVGAETTYYDQMLAEERAIKKKSAMMKMLIRMED